MSAHIKNSIFGVAVNALSNHKLFSHPEERPDFEIPSKFLLPSTSSSENHSSLSSKQERTFAGNSTITLVAEETKNVDVDVKKEDNAVKINNISPEDLEKAIAGVDEPEKHASSPVSDDFLVGWYSDQDPENPQ